MSIFTRTILKRFFAAAAKILLLLLWINIAVDLVRIIWGHDRLAQAEEVLNLLPRYALTLEMALTVAFPIGMIITLNNLKKSGILTLFLGSGLTISRIRRLLFYAAGITFFASVFAFEIGSYAGSMWQKTDNNPQVWKAGNVNICSLRYDSESRSLKNIILFNDQSFDVSRADNGAWSSTDKTFVLSPTEPLAGKPIILDRFPDNRKRSRFLNSRSLINWFTGEVKISEIMASINRIITGCVLLIISSYIALLLPLSRQYVAYMVFLFLALVVSLVVLYLSILVWYSAFYGCVSVVAWITMITTGMVLMDSYLKRRGILLS